MPANRSIHSFSPRWTDENAGLGAEASRHGRPVGWEPEYYLRARRLPVSPPALRSLGMARLFTATTAVLLAIALFNLAAAFA